MATSIRESMAYKIYFESLAGKDGESVCLNRQTISFAVYKLSE